MDIINKKNLVFYDKDWNSSNLSNERNLLLTIYGKVSCGKLKFIDDNVEGFVEIPSSFLGEDKYFVLKSDGDSMINAGIKKGDLLVIKMQSHAENGDIAVVELDNKVTLKRFYKLEDKHQYKLHPENEKYDDIYLEKCNILGVAVKIIKDI